MKETRNEARAAVETLVYEILSSIDNWRAKSSHSESFDAAVTLSALTNALVMVAMKYEVPPALVLTSVGATIELNAGVMERGDNTCH